jgi:hypothetical protein
MSKGICNDYINYQKHCVHCNLSIIQECKNKSDIEVTKCDSQVDANTG